jgi:hypothetical protein
LPSQLLSAAGSAFSSCIVMRPNQRPFPYISSRRAIRDLGWQITPFAEGLNFLVREVEGSEFRNTPEQPES